MYVSVCSTVSWSAACVSWSLTENKLTVTFSPSRDNSQTLQPLPMTSDNSLVMFTISWCRPRRRYVFSAYWEMTSVGMVLLLKTGWLQTWKTWSTHGFLWTWKTQGILREFCVTSGKIFNWWKVLVRSNVCITQQGLGLQMNKVSWIS